jgi:hypothetical protein
MGRRPSGNAAKTNAERQKAYRDRRRGGPPIKRTTAAEVAANYEMCRTCLFYALWLNQHRPDLSVLVERGELSVSRAYAIGRKEAAIARNDVDHVGVAEV